jgi:aminomethyltransferase
MYKTALYEMHKKHKAKFVSFANYMMPLQYSDGVMREHLHTRDSVGFFDVSHMGQIIVKPKSGLMSDASKCLEFLMPCNLVNQKYQQQSYSMLTNIKGGVIDDLMITNKGDHFFIVVNASQVSKDFNHISSAISQFCTVELIKDRSLLALQGPKSEEVLCRYSPVFSELLFLESSTINILGFDCWVSRSGYTGEDGYEISIPNAGVDIIAEAFLNEIEVKPIGLGARDSLRLEAGLCLYGSDLTEKISPIEASLTWAIHNERRFGGLNVGQFNGFKVILDQIQNGTKVKRVALLPHGRAPLRQCCELYESSSSLESIGYVSSGGFSPSLEKPISMAYVLTEFAKENVELFVDLRGNRVSAQISRFPFVSNKYKKT